MLHDQTSRTSAGSSSNCFTGGWIETERPSFITSRSEVAVQFPSRAAPRGLLKDACGRVKPSTREVDHCRVSRCYDSRLHSGSAPQRGDTLYGVRRRSSMGTDEMTIGRSSTLSGRKATHPSRTLVKWGQRTLTAGRPSTAKVPVHCDRSSGDMECKRA